MPAAVGAAEIQMYHESRDFERGVRIGRGDDKEHDGIMTATVFLPKGAKHKPHASLSSHQACHMPDLIISAMVHCFPSWLPQSHRKIIRFLFIFTSLAMPSRVSESIKSIEPGYVTVHGRTDF